MAILFYVKQAWAGIDDYTKLMLHGDEDPLTDSSDQNHSVTANGDAGRSAAQSKFGGYSVYFDGTGDYLSMADHADWDFGSGDFTIDFWFKRDAASGALEYINGYADNSGGNTGIGWLAFFNTSNQLRSGIASGSSAYVITDGSTVSDTDWHHFALVRDGNNLIQYLDGTADGSSVDVTGISHNTGVSFIHAVGRLGDYDGAYYAGYIDEYRISKGIARWTSNFTPPTQPYTT